MILMVFWLNWFWCRECWLLLMIFGVVWMVCGWCRGE